jgi:hypothetical protein
MNKYFKSKRRTIKSKRSRRSRSSKRIRRKRSRRSRSSKRSKIYETYYDELVDTINLVPHLYKKIFKFLPEKELREILNYKKYDKLCRERDHLYDVIEELEDRKKVLKDNIGDINNDIRTAKKEIKKKLKIINIMEDYFNTGVVPRKNSKYSYVKILE